MYAFQSFTMRRLPWILVRLFGLVLLQFLLQLVLLQLYSPKGHSIKNRFIDTGYGFFTHEVNDDLCSSHASKELAQNPSLVLQQSHELLQRHSQLADVLRGVRGRLGPTYSKVHWVARFAQLEPQGRLVLKQHLERLQSEQQDSVAVELQGSEVPDLSPELTTAASIYAKCAQKRGKAVSNSIGSQKDGSNRFSALELSTQQFLPGRFLGDPEKICLGFRGNNSQISDNHGNNICAPPLEVALQLVPLRLHDWWARVRWQYHMAEYLRKLLTVWWPLNPYMHMLYRQDMYAMLALMSPYLELEPPVPIDESCRPPKSYWVVPVSREQWEKQRHEALGHKEAGIVGKQSANSREGSASEFWADSQAQSQSPSSGSLSIPAKHDNYVPIDEYCEHARKIHHGFFTGKPRQRPVKIVDAVILGYDLDMLEIRWHELYHSVDYFVVAEAHQHTLGIFQKPLFFDRNKERYAAFAHKIIHLVQPFSASLRVAQLCSRRLLRDEDACWEYENFQRDSMLHMIAQVNAGVNDHGNPHIPPGFLGDDDLILVSDVDEIVMGDRLRHLKFCEPFPQKQFGWALVHYPGRVDAMALKDFKVMSGIEETRYPHSIGPLVDTVPYRSIRYLEKRADFVYDDGHAYVRHCSSELSPHKYLYGGWHLSDTSYLPYLYAKVPSDDMKPGYEPWGLYAPLLAQRGTFSSPVGGLLQAQVAAWKDFRDYRQVGSLCVEAKETAGMFNLCSLEILWTGRREEVGFEGASDCGRKLRRRLRGQNQVPEQYKEIGFGSMPWVMRCNPVRYPTWFQQPDPRYSMMPRSSFVVYGETVNAHSLGEWFSIFRFIRDTYSADITGRGIPAVQP